MRSAILELKNIRKEFSGVEALGGVDLDLYPGEVHAVVGINGAGKSTIVKIIAGVYRPDHGQILFKGKAISIGSPIHALDLGTHVVYQNFNLISNNGCGGEHLFK